MDAKELIAQANAQQPQLIAQFKQAVASEQLLKQLVLKNVATYMID